MKILIKKINPKSIIPTIITKGDWIDLYCPEDYNLKAGQYECIKLGIAVKLPSGFEAVVVPRSSSYRKFGFIMTGSIGVIDNEYNGNGDEWMLPIYSLKNGIINEGNRIAQFRIQLSQKATMWQKIKWLFSNYIEIKHVGYFKDTFNRGGLGSTGV